MDQNSILTFILDNLKNFFYPEEMLALDLKLAKSELLALLVLDRQGELTMSQFADNMHMPMNTATGLINRLVEGGYVLRERSESDRRLVLIKLSVAGRETAGKFKDMISDYTEFISKILTEEEKETVLKVAFKVLESLKTKAVSKREDGNETPQVERIEIE